MEYSKKHKEIENNIKKKLAPKYHKICEERRMIERAMAKEYSKLCNELNDEYKNYVGKRVHIECFNPYLKTVVNSNQPMDGILKGFRYMIHEFPGSKTIHVVIENETGSETYIGISVYNDLDIKIVDE